MKTLFIETMDDFTKIKIQHEEAEAQANDYEYEVVIKDAITAIPKETFKECLRLTKLSIPDSVTEIGPSAFENCGIESVYIPDSVTNIGWAAFKRCYWLTNVRLSPNIKEIPGECFAGTFVQTVEIPEGVKEIGPSAFECTQLEYLIIPDTVTKIWDKAFCKCAFLTHITLSKKLTKIPFRCFEHCHRLETIEIPEGVKEINSAFNDCRTLSEILIPDSVKEIGYGTFRGTYIYPTDVPERFRNENVFPKGDLLTFADWMD